jgi:hypothetical protein
MGESGLAIDGILEKDKRMKMQKIIKEPRYMIDAPKLMRDHAIVCLA